jgi:hypothetical protein
MYNTLPNVDGWVVGGWWWCNASVRILLPQRQSQSPSVLAVIHAAVWRLLSEAPLSQAPGPVNARIATRSRVATSVRSFSTSATKLSAPLPPYLAPVARRCSAIALCLGGAFFVLGRPLRVFRR